MHVSIDSLSGHPYFQPSSLLEDQHQEIWPTITGVTGVQKRYRCQSHHLGSVVSSQGFENGNFSDCWLHRDCGEDAVITAGPRNRFDP
jgi:hypothetical protein